MEAISVLTGLIVVVAMLATVYVISNIFAPQQELEPLVRPTTVWPFETRDKGIFLALRFIDYEHGECFCELERVDSITNPSRMATRIDHQQIAKTAIPVRMDESTLRKLA
jgi:hypothetical protein